MKNNVHYSPKARNDLDEIWEYISFELCNPQAAENTVNKIFYRSIGQDVYIDRVLYGRRDYLRILFSDFQQDDSEG